MPKFFIRILQPKVPNPKIYTRNLIVRTFINTMGFSLRFQVAGAFLKANGKRYSYLEIQYGGQNVISFVLSCHSSKICQKDRPHQNVFKLTLNQKSFYVFRKDRQHKYFFFLSPSLDLINISVPALEAVKVAGETLQRSWRTSPAAGFYLQLCTTARNTKNLLTHFTVNTQKFRV